MSILKVRIKTWQQMKSISGVIEQETIKNGPKCLKCEGSSYGFHEYMEKLLPLRDRTISLVKGHIGNEWVNGASRMGSNSMIDNWMIDEILSETISPAPTFKIEFYGSCFACSFPVIRQGNEDELGNDGFYYCSNKRCHFHSGEDVGEQHDLPNWVFDPNAS